MLRLLLAASLLSLTASSAIAAPLYLSVPSRYILRAEDFKKNDLDSPWVAPSFAKDVGSRVVEILLQGRAIRDEDEGPNRTFKVLYEPFVLLSLFQPSTLCM